jgi:AraC-like DNA-binding protein
MPEITFMRSGMWVCRHGRQGTPCDSNTLLFLNVDEPYSMSHPVHARCACTALLVEPAVLRDLVRAHDPAAADRGDHLFAIGHCPCAVDTTLDHYALLRLARDMDGSDPLAVEEAGLALARRAVAAAYRFNGRRPRRARPGTDRAHADLAHATKEILAARYRERLRLDEVARAVHAAPNHLCTVFKRETGSSIHAYITRLRLAAAVESLSSAPRPLARLALEMGFCHHSHFSTSFRRVYGESPSQVMRRLRPPAPGSNT